jgi:tRNA (guanine-N7-)-methyltransferase
MSEPEQNGAILNYHATSFSQGRMDFAWEELGDAERRALYEDWQAGKGLIGGHPKHRPGYDRLPMWGINQSFFRAFALDDERGWNGERLRSELASNRLLEIEIGFGRGDFMLDRTQRFPDRLFLGYEVRTKSVRLSLKRVARLGLDNLWISDDDARVNLPAVIPDGRIDIVHVLFPDPWWK